MIDNCPKCGEENIPTAWGDTADGGIIRDYRCECGHSWQKKEKTLKDGE